jgi:hypothetical protein
MAETGPAHHMRWPIKVAERHREAAQRNPKNQSGLGFARLQPGPSPTPPAPVKEHNHERPPPPPRHRDATLVATRRRADQRRPSSPGSHLRRPLSLDCLRRLGPPTPCKGWRQRGSSLATRVITLDVALGCDMGGSLFFCFCHFSFTRHASSSYTFYIPTFFLSCESKEA